MTLDLLCLGEPLVEFNETEPGLWREGFGGDVSNVAVAAARQGLASGVATRLGADVFADRLRAMWAEEGVDASAVDRDEDAPTGLYFVRHGPEGHVFDYRRTGSAASRLSPQTLPEDSIRSARCLHLSGITLAISPTAEAAAFRAIEIAKEERRIVAFDTNLRLRLWPLSRARDPIHRAASLADILLPSLDDAHALTGLHDPDAIADFYLKLGPQVVALTLGPAGALVATRDSRARIPAREAKLLDATGAGDCFDGVFLSALLRGAEPEDAARRAVAASALSVERRGAVASFPTAAELDEALAG